MCEKNMKIYSCIDVNQITNIDYITGRFTLRASARRACRGHVEMRDEGEDE